MKTKLVSLITVLLGLSFTFAAAKDLNVKGNVGTKYTSDYLRRGQLVSDEAIQAQVGFNVGVGQIDFFGDLFTNQATSSSSADNDEVIVGLGTVLLENKLNAYAGVYNTSNSLNGDTLEAFASLGLNTLLSPSLSVYRDTDESLYTVEGEVSHDFDLGIANLEVAGFLGQTDLTSVTDSTYYGAKFTASKTLKEDLKVYADLSLSDTDTRDYETVWGLGLRLKF
jgi:hypothetical protein